MPRIHEKRQYVKENRCGREQKTNTRSLLLWRHHYGHAWQASTKQEQDLRCLKYTVRDEKRREMRNSMDETHKLSSLSNTNITSANPNKNTQKKREKN